MECVKLINQDLKGEVGEIFEQIDTKENDLALDLFKDKIQRLKLLGAGNRVGIEWPKLDEDYDQLMSFNGKLKSISWAQNHDFVAFKAFRFEFTNEKGETLKSPNLCYSKG